MLILDVKDFKTLNLKDALNLFLSSTEHKVGGSTILRIDIYVISAFWRQNGDSRSEHLYGFS